MRRSWIGLCLLMYVAGGTSAMPSPKSAPIKAFLAHTDVKYGSDDDARTLEGRLYAWGMAGASLEVLQTRTAQAFKLPRELADQLVLLTLQRGAGKNRDGSDGALIDRYIALAHAYPQSPLAMIEAGRTINVPFSECNVDAYERLLQGRLHADADRVALFQQFACLPLLTERKVRDREFHAQPLVWAAEGSRMSKGRCDDHEAVGRLLLDAGSPVDWVPDREPADAVLEIIEAWQRERRQVT